jgi:crotonobetainyl-CoA:carnitine CoA-transferase CaiB-like acyl-CoA transferase
MTEPPPLAGVRVIDFTHMRAGPQCTMMLGDMGAEVIKIEAPQGDSTRRYGEDIAGEGLDFLSVNRNKKSVVLDLKSAEGKSAAMDLIAGADVVVENFRIGVMDRLGFGYESLAAHFPRLIYCSVTAYGQTGPYALRPGYDQIAQGLSGIMSVTGTEETGPLRVGLPIADLMAGAFAAYGVVLALFERERSGRGQFVHSSLLRSLVSMLSFQGARHLMTGAVPGVVGKHHPMVVPNGTFATADGLINIGCSTQRQWELLCEALEAPELAADPRYADTRARAAHLDELVVDLERCLATRGRGEWIERMVALDVPCGPVYRIDEVFADPQVQAESLAVTPDTDHPTVGKVPMPGFPVVLQRTPPRAVLPPPMLGQHTHEVLSALVRARRETQAATRAATGVS